MEKITPIIEELKEYGSSLGNFPVLTPYKVPAGYFDEFPALMFSIVTEAPLSAHLTGQPTPYRVPGGYFDALPAAILKKAIASTAGTQSLPSNPGQSNTGQPKVDFSASELPASGLPASELGASELPASELPSSDQSAAEELSDLSSILSGIGNKTPFSVPDNYFGELSGNIISGAQAVDLVNEELENLSPLMTSLKPVNVYDVPNGYFENLPGIIIKKASIKKADQPADTVAKVINVNFRRRILQYAAAAVITGLIMTAGFFTWNRDKGQQEIVSINGLKEKTAATSDEEILNYLAIQPVAMVDSLIIADPEIKADAILDMLANVSDEELQQYMQLQSDTKTLIN